MTQSAAGAAATLSLTWHCFRFVKPALKKSLFPTAHDAEAAFYEALERGDLEAMMEVWAEDEEIVCIHPGGMRLAGPEAIREGWRQIFSSGTRMRVRLSNQSHINAVMVAIHSLHENIAVTGESKSRGVVVATNVYQRTAAGWRMVLHHASPAPESPARGETKPAVLH
jgi:uncharacterized protein (TIGR02246 family)